MSSGYRFEKWECDLCNAEGTDTESANDHIEHAAGWSLRATSTPSSTGSTPTTRTRSRGSSGPWIGMLCERISADSAVSPRWA
jgi:hypothetical protein